MTILSVGLSGGFAALVVFKDCDFDIVKSFSDISREFVFFGRFKGAFLRGELYKL